eukprot:jgi/Tetstr1/456884/TSEL_043555.t1
MAASAWSAAGKRRHPLAAPIAGDASGHDGPVTKGPRVLQDVPLLAANSAQAPSLGRRRQGPQQCGVRESDAAGDDGIRGGGAARGVGPRAPVEAASGRAPAARKRPMRCRLEDWALPAPVIAAFHAKGVTQMYPWQAAAVEEGSAGDNLVFSAPTSGGKSLVAEVLMVRRLLEVRRRWMAGPAAAQGRRRKRPRPRALVVLPYISIVSEKVAHLQEVLSPMGLEVRGYAGLETCQPISEHGEDIAICTIEKANSAVNRLVLEGRVAQLACVVIDEMHMISDKERGVVLELAVTKILFAERCARERMCQIIAMSATMRGLQALSDWLNARLFITNYRPVPLTEHAVFEGVVYEKCAALSPTGEADSAGGEVLRKLRDLRDLKPAGRPGRKAVQDEDGLLRLVAEVVAEGHSVLVFCQSRQQCQSCATRMAAALPEVVWGAHGRPWPPAQAEQLRAALCERLVEATEGSPDPELTTALRSGIAYHHAGLTAEEREIVEDGYRQGTLQVIAATSTLAAGINLPARRVILRSLRQGVENVSRAQYLQMVGRAGRAGQCDRGDSFIIGKGGVGRQEWLAINRLLAAPLPELSSQLIAERGAGAGQGKSTSRPAPPADAPAPRDDGGTSLERLLLESVANGAVRSGRDVKNLICSTLAAHQASKSGQLVEQIKVELSRLQRCKLLRWERPAPLGTQPMQGPASSQEEGRWCVSQMGSAVHSASLPTEQGKRMYERLDAARRDLCLVDGGVLHLAFVLLEASGSGDLVHFRGWPDWSQCLAVLLEASARSGSAPHMVGVEHHLRMRRPGYKPPDNRHTLFFTALILADLLDEKGLQPTIEAWEQVAQAGSMSRGRLQKMQRDMAKTAAMAAQLAASASWWSLESLLNTMSAQAAAGAKPELLALMKVPTLTALQARSLYNRGIKTPQMLAEADGDVLRRALVEAAPSDKRLRPTAGGRGRGRGRGAGTRVNALGSAAAVERLAASLPKLAWQHLVEEAEEAARLMANAGEGEGEGEAPVSPTPLPAGDHPLSCSGPDDTAGAALPESAVGPRGARLSSMRTLSLPHA